MISTVDFSFMILLQLQLSNDPLVEDPMFFPSKSLEELREDAKTGALDFDEFRKQTKQV